MSRIAPTLIAAMLLLGHTAAADVAPAPQVELTVTGGFIRVDSFDLSRAALSARQRDDATAGVGWDIAMKVTRGSGDSATGEIAFVGRMTTAGKRDAEPHQCTTSCSTGNRAYDLDTTGTTSLTLSW